MSTYRFDEFTLDARNRVLKRGREVVPMSARYFDALQLLVRRHGDLVEKDDFFREVWSDVVVSDAALTQCIKEIRSSLGDDSLQPRYIKTVPKHGYTFIGRVAEAEADAASDARWQGSLKRVGGGTAGGAAAGLFGGLIYGMSLAFAPYDPHPGAASILLVLVLVNVMVGSAGALGVSAGIAAARHRASPAWLIPGGAAGGFLVGGLAKLFGMDAFQLFFGRSPVGTTGAFEGGILGAAVGLTLFLSPRLKSPWSALLVAASVSAAAGALIGAAGGTLMGGSLDALGRSFDGSRLHLDALAGVFGEVAFGLATRIVLTISDAVLFGVFVVGGLLAAERGSVNMK